MQRIQKVLYYNLYDQQQEEKQLCCDGEPHQRLNPA